MLTYICANRLSRPAHYCQVSLQNIRLEDNLEKSRAEAGVIQYDLLKDAKKPNTYNLWQRYASPEVVKEHMATDHVKEMFTKLPPLLAAPFLQTDYRSAY